MTAYTLLWTRTTWDESATRVRPGTPYYIDYVAAEDKRPFKDIVADDEIFVLAVIGGNLYIGGRLIAKSSPISQMEAISSLGRSDLVKKKLYVLAKPDNRDIFRAYKLVDLKDAQNLELITSTGVNKRPDLDNKTKMISENTFRPNYKLSPKSATILRNYLGLPEEAATITQNAPRDSYTESLESKPIEVAGSASVNLDKHQGADEDESSVEVKSRDRIEDLRNDVESALWRIGVEYANKPGEDVDAIVKRRIGQGAFRNYLEEIYGVKCCVSGVTNRKLLIASHIVPWSKSSPTQKTHHENGLLLSISWDALFDKGFVSFDDEGKLLCSEKLDEDTVQRLGISMNAKLLKDMISEERMKNLSWHRKNHGFEA